MIDDLIHYILDHTERGVRVRQIWTEWKLQHIQGGYCGPRLSASGHSNWARARRARLMARLLDGRAR
jgi:hypothetical protein